MAVTIYHNPRCGKSRQTLELLTQKGMEPEVIDYLAAPLDTAQLSALLGLLGMEPRGLMRRKEAVYRELGLDEESLSREDLIAAMAANPILIERPIVVTNGKAAIGRPPEAVLAIL